MFRALLLRSFKLAPLVLAKGGLADAAVAAEVRLSRSDQRALHGAVLCFLASMARTARGCSFINQHMSPEPLRRVVSALTAPNHPTYAPSVRAQLLSNLMLLPCVSRAVLADAWESRLFCTAHAPPALAPDDDLWDRRCSGPPTSREAADVACKLRCLLHCCVWSPHFAHEMSTGGGALLARLRDIVCNLTRAPGLTDTVTGQFVPSPIPSLPRVRHRAMSVRRHAAVVCSVCGPSPRRAALGRRGRAHAL